jgi:UrcA family protein
MSFAHQLTLRIVGGASFLVMAAPAASQSQPIVVTGHPPGHEAVMQKVSYGDLNLTTGDGALELQRRVKSAVTRICPLRSGHIQLHERREAEACQKSAWASAQPQMDHAIAAARGAHHK